MPEEPTFQVTLNEDELHAVIKFHTAQIRRITKALGEATLKIRAQPFSSTRVVKACIEQAEELANGHLNRAKVLSLHLHKKKS